MSVNAKNFFIPNEIQQETLETRLRLLSVKSKSVYERELMEEAFLISAAEMCWKYINLRLQMWDFSYHVWLENIVDLRKAKYMRYLVTDAKTRSTTDC